MAEFPEVPVVPNDVPLLLNTAELLLSSAFSSLATPAPAAVTSDWLVRYSLALERRSPEMQGMP